MSFDENIHLKEVVSKDTILKEWLVNYVGVCLDPKDDKITVEMIVEVIAKEFPEFLLAVAEENFIRGYSQALNDAEAGYKILDKEKNKRKSSRKKKK